MDLIRAVVKRRSTKSQEEIDELYSILRQMEAGSDD